MSLRDDAWRLLTEWTQGESLRRHALAVEACMRWHARKFGEDEDLWAATGLLHDFDYERNPDAPAHPTVGMAYLREHGWPEPLVHAIGGHAEYLGIPRETLLDRALFAVDELSGLIVACALIRPSKSLAEVTPESVMKSYRKPAFARAVNREDVRRGAEELGVALEEHVANCLAALQEAAPALGL
ncbi:MAG TPA: HDIG domain-containing protein [Chthonomonadaceae bacterium]|nr:HDIG domain-containing protein [Chthonomonadaceae bacterium]